MVRFLVVGLGWYIAAIKEVPFVSAFLFSVAVQVDHRLPGLNTVHATQVSMWSPRLR
jgi:hypothetical protein